MTEVPSRTRSNLYPAIDLREGKVVRLIQGNYDDQRTYREEPLNVARQFEQAGAKWLHMVDLDAARSGKQTQQPIIEQICHNTSLNVQVGGGVRDRQKIEALLALGVQRVVVGTAATKDWTWFERIVHEQQFAQRLVLGIDARDGMVAIAGWEQVTQITATDLARRTQGWPLAAIVYTDIAQDGMMTGPNYDAIEQMTLATDVPIIASGGVGTLEHLQKLAQMNRNGVNLAGAIVGRALYENAFTIEQALAAYPA